MNPSYSLNLKATSDQFFRMTPKINGEEYISVAKKLVKNESINLF